MNQTVKIEVAGTKITLRSIGDCDCEMLRMWKNANRHAFFHDKVINKEEQAKWFEEYISNKNNYMFIVEESSRPVGCIGFKLINGAADIYNVILGEEAFRRKGMLSIALKRLCSYILENHTKKISLRVLESNVVAHAFYMKNGFVMKTKRDDSVLMELSGDDRDVR